MRIGRAACEVDLPRGNLHHEQQVVRHQSTSAQDLDRRELNRGQHVPIGLDEGRPRGLAFSIWCGLDAVFPNTLPTVWSQMRYPTFANAPQIQSYPRDGFFLAKRRINATITWRLRGPPTLFRLSPESHFLATSIGCHRKILQQQIVPDVCGEVIDDTIHRGCRQRRAVDYWDPYRVGVRE